MLIGLDMSTNPPTRRELQCDAQGRLIISGTVSGGDGGGSSDTTEATQLLVKAATQSIATTSGAPADTRAPWYDSAASLVSLLKLSIAAFVGAGSRSYIYTSGRLTSETWTLFGVIRTKTYTYTAGVLTGESDWAQ